MPFDLGIPISKNCKICQVFLFLRPARSFFDRALGSPQAYIPAPTAVWTHCSTGKLRLSVVFFTCFGERCECVGVVGVSPMVTVGRFELSFATIGYRIALVFRTCPFCCQSGCLERFSGFYADHCPAPYAGAAVAFAPASDDGLPFTTASWTQPPDSLSATCSDFSRSQIAILSGMPLCCELWIGGCQIVEAFKQFAFVAIRTTAAFCPGYHGCFPAVAALSQPPNLPMAPSCNTSRLQITILFWMPFRCEFWVNSCKVIETFQDLHVAAVRTAVTTFCSGNNLRLPLMPGTVRHLMSPPNFPSASICDFGRFQITVFGRMPIGGNLRILRSKIVKTCKNSAPRTILAT